MSEVKTYIVEAKEIVVHRFKIRARSAKLAKARVSKWAKRELRIHRKILDIEVQND